MSVFVDAKPERAKRRTTRTYFLTAKYLDRSKAVIHGETYYGQRYERKLTSNIFSKLATLSDNDQESYRM